MRPRPMEFRRKLADVVAERLRPVVDDVVHLAAPTVVDGIGRRLGDVVDVYPGHDPVAGHRRQRPPLRQPHEQFVVRHTRPVEAPVAQHDSLGVAVLTGGQDSLLHAAQRRQHLRPRPSAAALGTGRSRPSPQARSSDSRRRRSPTPRRPDARLPAARRRTRFGAPVLHSFLAGSKSLTRMGPRFGSVVSSETTTSGSTSATTLSISSASNTSATTGLAARRLDLRGLRRRTGQADDLVAAGVQLAQQRQAREHLSHLQPTHASDRPAPSPQTTLARNAIARITVVTTSPPASIQPIRSPAPWCGSMMWLIECSAQCTVANARAGTRHDARRTAASSSRPCGTSNVALSKM